MERVGLRDEADASGAPILQTHLSPPTRLIPPYPALSALLWCLTLGLTSLHTMPMPSGMKLPVFSLGDDIYTWQDVVAHARATGDWASLEQAAREGAACEALADSGEIDEPDADIEHAAEEFRYERDLVTAAGGRIVHADVTIICEAPRIGPHRDAMRQLIAERLRLPMARISVKATTTERLGFTGRGEGIAAQAIATILMPELE